MMTVSGHLFVVVLPYNADRPCALTYGTLEESCNCQTSEAGKVIAVLLILPNVDSADVEQRVRSGSKGPCRKADSRPLHNFICFTPQSFCTFPKVVVAPPPCDAAPAVIYYSALQ